MESEPKLTVSEEKESGEKLSLNILVADDDSAMRDLFEFILKSMGYKVKIVENGQLLVDELSEEGESYDLVISDNTMPEKMGVEALKEIRSIERLKRIPFIIATTDISPDGSLEKQVVQLGGFYLPKPFSKQQLFNMIRQATKEKI